MKYVKPELKTDVFCIQETIADGGLGQWLDDQNFDASAANNITTYEVNSQALGSRTLYGLKLEISLNTAEIPANIRKYNS